MIRVLLVDDHTILREGLKQILSECPDMLVAGEAKNGLEALKQMRESDWGAVVMDISLPGRSGLELIKQIKDEKPKLPILVLSMHKEEQYAVRALKAGASGYMTKESASFLLVSAIRKVAGGGIFLSEEMAESLAFSLHPKSDAPPHTLLSDREYQIFMLMLQGRSITEIGEQLCVSVKTVSTHKARILYKMKVDNVPALVKYAIRYGLIDSEELE